MLRRALYAAVLIAVCPWLAQAADQTVLGKQLLVKNPSTPDKRKIIVKALEPATDNTLGDPTVSGGSISVALYGGSESSQLFPLPQGLDGKGKPFWSGDATKGYKYKDSAGVNGPVKGVKLKIKNGQFQMKALISGKLGTVSVLPPDDGTAGCAQLSITGGDSYSVRFADGALKNKDGKLFAVKDPTTQGTCIQCGNGFIEAAEQCDRPGTSCGGSTVCQSDCTCPCDMLDEADCLFPFPSDYLTKPDSSTDSGRRVHFAVDTMPRNNQNVYIEPSDYNWNDGFSQGASILVHVPNVDLAVTGAPPITDIEQSLEADSPVIVLNADTLQQHLVWAEIDSNASSPATQAVIIRPAVSFAEGGRYIVALRNMKNSGGNGIPAGTAFAAYRDDTPTGDPVKEARRAHMEDIFSTLDAAGIDRDDLYLAWDFTVASARNTTERLLFMRDDAFGRLGMAAPNFTVGTVQNGVDSNIYRIVNGTFDVERYVGTTFPPTRFILDGNGMPTHQATPQPANFRCIIPHAALDNAMATAVPARASIYGHGLLGSHTEVGAGNVRAMANEHNFVFCATDWMGMSSADYLPTVGILQNLSSFPFLADRLQQGMVNQLFLARLMIHPAGFVSHAAFQDAMGNPVIDTSDVFFDGNSQGGIFGGTIMAVAQDITRGVLGVPAMNYSLLLTRSSDFEEYATVLYPSYPNELQRPLILALIQMLWDRAEPNGYAQHIVSDPLPGTPAKSVLLHEAFGDFQVANIGTEIEARTMGINVYQPALAPMRHSDVNPYYGIPAVPGSPFNGSALVVWDSGTATPPITNTPPNVGSDPHGAPRSSVIGRQQKSAFLQTGGAFVDVCSGAPCVP
jgi:hypothetical protein